MSYYECNLPRYLQKDLSYLNSCFSEHIASTVFGMLGIPAQETRLGTFANGREHVVCACRDFTDADRALHDFCSIKNAVLESESDGTGTELSSLAWPPGTRGFSEGRAGSVALRYSIAAIGFYG